MKKFVTHDNTLSVYKQLLLVYKHYLYKHNDDSSLVFECLEMQNQSSSLDSQRFKMNHLKDKCYYKKSLSHNTYIYITQSLEAPGETYTIMLLMGIWMSLTKNPMNPIIRNPTAVAKAIFWNSTEKSYNLFIMKSLNVNISDFWTTLQFKSRKIRTLSV